jgi:hypothetical protein
MPTTDRERLEELPVPPESVRFFEDLRERMQEHDRASAARWRRVSAALAVVAAAAIAAVAVVAATFGGASTVDRTVSCATKDGAVHVFANATIPQIAGASAGVTTGPVTPVTQLFAVDTRYSGFLLDRSRCRTVRTKISLARAGLPSAGVFVAGNSRGLGGHCAATGHVILRLRVHLDSSGKPEDAKVAVWNESKQQKPTRPIAFLQWSPQRLLTYLSPVCVTD